MKLDNAALQPDAFLYKPFSAQELRETRLIGQHRRRRFAAAGKCGDVSGCFFQYISKQSSVECAQAGKCTGRYTETPLPCRRGFALKPDARIHQGGRDALGMGSAVRDYRASAGVGTFVQPNDGAIDITLGHAESMYGIHHRDAGLTADLFNAILCEHGAASSFSFVCSRGRANQKVPSAAATFVSFTQR